MSIFPLVHMYGSSIPYTDELYKKKGHCFKIQLLKNRHTIVSLNRSAIKNATAANYSYSIVYECIIKSSLVTARLVAFKLGGIHKLS